MKKPPFGQLFYVQQILLKLELRFYHAHIQDCFFPAQVEIMRSAGGSAMEKPDAIKIALQSDTIFVNDIEMYYQTHGQGEPLVLLHGFGGSAGDWAYIPNEWAKEYRLVIPDLRGQGHSTNPSGVFTHLQAAQDVFALLDHLGIDKFTAVGISGGANILLHLSTQQPSRVQKMVLVSATPYFPSQARAVMARFGDDVLSEPERQAMRKRHHHGEEQVQAIYAQARAFKDSYDDMNFTPPYLGTITAETLIVYGDRDFLYPATIALEMYQAIPRSYLWIIPNGGHGPVFGSLSGQFVATASAFLRGEWTRQATPPIPSR
jgi:pimeloyl-ACP methyl ester carboxylesterase